MPPIRFEWVDETLGIIKGLYPKGWNWNDYHENLDHLRETLTGRTESFYFINVYENGARLPSSSPLPHHLRAARDINVRYVVYVTTDPILIATLRVLLRGIKYVEHENYNFAETEDAALQLIRSKHKAMG